MFLLDLDLYHQVEIEFSIVLLSSKYIFSYLSAKLLYSQGSNSKSNRQGACFKSHTVADSGTGHFTSASSLLN